MVFEKIREIIAEQTGKNVEEITLETNVKEDLDIPTLHQPGQKYLSLRNSFYKVLFPFLHIVRPGR